MVHMPENAKAKYWEIVMALQYVIDPVNNLEIWDIFIWNLKMINKLFQGQIERHF